MNRISDFDLKDKKVLIRADLNVPIRSGIISSENRIQASLPTILYAMKEGAKVMVTSHLGRPDEGHFSLEDSLEPVAKYLSNYLNQTVPLIKNWISEPFNLDSRNLANSSAPLIILFFVVVIANSIVKILYVCKIY